jgi:hypothetical protein
MEKEIIQREEELFHVASSTRCLSCGQVQRESWQAATPGPANKKRVVTVPSAVPSRGSLSPGGSVVSEGGESLPPSLLAPQEAGGYLTAGTGPRSPMDDEMTEGGQYSLQSKASSPPPAFMTAEASSANPYSLQGQEQVYALLTGQAGLKPLQLQHAPMIPQTPSRPHTTAAGAQGKKKPPGEKIPDAAARRAKLSAHVKEMVKVAAPAAEQYGYSSANPLYVMEGAVVDDSDAISVLSTASSRQLIGSHSLTALPSQQTRAHRPPINELAIVSDPRVTKGSRRTGGDVLVLPDIHSGGGGSKPGSPNSLASRDTSRRRRGSAGDKEPQLVVSQVKLASYL